MTSAQRIWAVINSTRYIATQGVPGDIVECGVWRGGSMMAAALTLLHEGESDRGLWLYDTFEGMTSPTSVDREWHSGDPASALLEQESRTPGRGVWAMATEEEVRKNVASTGYPSANVRYVRGDVAETLKAYVPDRIALLRLDTDWYESTKVELATLYPKLVVGGVCIIDDYGHWQGARQAVDEYFGQVSPRPLLHTIDYTGRILVKGA